MSISINQQSALELTSVRVAYFVEMYFTSGIQRVSTFNQPVTWGGNEWLGLGTIVGIGSVSESDGLEASSLNFSINAAQPSWIAIAAGPTEEYRGNSIRMFMCPLDEGFQLIGTPEICWRGLMDMISIGVDGDSGSISLKCETSAYGLKRRPTLRLNAAQHKTKYPSDTGFDYLTDLIANPQSWLSKKFQQV
jgi:hypothetical protein